MFVVKVKDILKYLVSIILLITIIILSSRFFLNIFKENRNQTKHLTKNALTASLAAVMPNTELKEENKQIEGDKRTNIQKILDMELGFVQLCQKEKSNPASEEVKEEVKEELEEARTDVGTQIIDSGIENKFTNSYGSVQVKNTSKYDLTQDILTPNFELTNKKDLIIYHTHTCESYTPTEKFNYEQTGSFRTTDLNFTVSRVGAELTNYLKNYGYNVTHDKTYHDYPAYSGSYDRSMNTVKKLLKSNQNTQMIIDLHRDAIGSSSSYAPKVKIGDEYASQLMFVIGTDGGGLEHKNWQRNLKFAIKIQEKANEMYPGLFKPITLRNSRYNQNVADAATIIEVGATGNTMEECLTSMKYLSKVISEVIK